MAIREQTHDLCVSFNLLGDLAKHFSYDETLRPEIVASCSPVLESKDNFCNTPESFNMHVLFNQTQNVLDVNSTKQNQTQSSSFDYLQHFPPQTTPLLYQQMKTTPLFINTNSTYFDNKLAKDIISSARYITDSEQNPPNDILDKKNITQCSNTYNIDKAIPTYIHGEISDSYDYEVENNFWTDLQLRWEALAKTDLESHPWLVNHEEAERELNYQFSVRNCAKSTHKDFMKYGIELLSQGQLTLAIATFEAELQARPENSKAWLYLGSSHAENEQDEFSISALRRCITLDPKNMDARLLLAVGYANESKNWQSCKILREWLLNHPCFCSLFPLEDLNDTNEPYMPSFLDQKFYQEVSELFELALSSAMGNLQEISDLHVATGILHHLAEQYSRSVKHFKIALSLQTDNPMLWNKLGATLANGDRSEEAIHAYKEALRLYPNYVRCRYNMGIACMNLKSFPEACEHFLIAIKLQSQGRGPSATAWNLWTTLRLALMLGDMPHLFPAVDNRDLDSLLVEFHLND